ncbi:hypothetical protein [Neomegalonema perideroedes]|uniref:hypothetical protein n=1 Tax=Neomegalonema perideroedes TaxID=217219 RepID=UPI00039AF213|nr:hypothetical protein [Neomegalonema perideroedes]
MIHPGPRGPERILARRAGLRPITGVLAKGKTVAQAVGELFAAQGCKGGTLRLDGALCAPLRFVLPAPSTDGLHAAWYSAVQAPEGLWRIRQATTSVGWREGAPFLHCHGSWRPETGGAEAMGHLLPPETLLAENLQVRGLGAAESWFEALPDEETAFTLFTPAGGGSGKGLIARLLPGEDVAGAVEALAAAHGLREARLHGVGSIDHILFADGRRMDCLATELHFTEAFLRAGRASIEIEAVDVHARIMRGALAGEGNPVGVTLELVIENLGE